MEKLRNDLGALNLYKCFLPGIASSEISLDDFFKKYLKMIE